MEEKGRRYLFDNPRNVKALIYGLYALCAVLFALDFFIPRHGKHPWESLFGFYGIYGFVVCVILVLAAKEMRKVLGRKDDYYDD